MGRVKQEHPRYAWGQPISEERQAELQAFLDKWAAERDHGDRKGPFDEHVKNAVEREKIALCGADVFWLAMQAQHSGGIKILGQECANLHLEGANLFGVHLEGANLGGAHMERVNLGGAHLENASLQKAHLKGADLTGACVKDVYFYEAHLEGAYLSQARAEGAKFINARMEDTNLSHAHLEGAIFLEAHLEGADLRNAWMDKSTYLFNASLDRASVDQLSYDGTNLAVVKWEAVKVLGDEVQAHLANYPTKNGSRKDTQARLDGYEAAVRAHRQLAAQLRAQGMSEVADRFAYRAQVLQRQVLLRSGHLGGAFGSWLLDLISGYGYKPMRSVITYIVVILAFAVAYFALTNFDLTPFLSSHSSPLAWYEALVLSIFSFHGRGLFPNNISLGDPVAILAAFEAIIGLLIEITFIATFTQRFFGSK